MQIVVYTQPNCVLSQVWIETLRGRGVAFTQRNVGHDAAAAAELRSIGPLATPTTVVDGRRHTGFDRGLLARLTAGSA